ncbi:MULTISPECIES: protein translocase SEC61 complex subunit gamma [Methanobacterium]|jgi:protein transport protein SEC61 subunit gamma-like protein|uniref:Protein translocase subunit SecE n=1 Tax=Methanobacterium veterum TaxID=408577 RepID=A0A9E4ZVT8_9EURY|nr:MULTISPECIES: protein translocase SEC61 complex subunit gamma [Methanobacterium]MCZ3365031.1 protein translocase SEC61 complex subunit gamma [Methanobacterium veterum]MCZ3372786.1 protein translocase SEC61 complex subunit gamma [Methanobacterium veterum]
MNLNKESITQALKQYRRVLYISKRPERDEYINVAKITGIGIIIIGVIGFVITLVAQLIGQT